jgi:adenine/guanine/hypoxanthine permease
MTDGGVKSNTPNNVKMRALDSVRTYFEFERHRTSFVTEILAGITTYLSLSYIFVVNPTILSKAGMNPSAVLFATVVASAAATVLMGLWAKLPFAVAPGLEMNGYFALIICGTLNLHWTQGLTVVLLSGVLNVVFTRMQLRDNVVTAIPLGLKRALSTCIGAFVIAIALQLAGIITYTQAGVIDTTMVTRESFVSNSAVVMYIGTLVALFLGPNVINFPLNILGSLLVSIVLCLYWNIIPTQEFNYSKDMLAAVGKVDVSLVSYLSDGRVVGAIIVLFIIDFVGGAGKIVGLSAATNIQDNGGVPGLKRALYVDGAGTILGALLGTSSLVAFVESGVGIKAGGRTGLTAVVCAALMSISFLFEPLLRFIPPQAAAGVLVFVGYLLTPWKIDPTGKLPHTVFDITVGYIMAFVAFMTFGIDKAMAVGFSMYFIKAILARESTQTTWWLGAIAIVLDAASVMHLYM